MLPRVLVHSRGETLGIRSYWIATDGFTKSSLAIDIVPIH